MSKLSLMILTLVILATILCKHSVHSRKRKEIQGFPCKCTFHRDRIQNMKRNLSEDAILCICTERKCCCDGDNENNDYSDYIEFMKRRFSSKPNALCVCKKKIGANRKKEHLYSVVIPV